MAYIVALILGSLLVTPPSYANAILSTELPDIVEKVLPGVVNISSMTIQRTSVYGMDEYFQLWRMPKEQPQTSLGSGFIVSADGYVFTNYHVVAHADEVAVTLLNRKTYKAKIVGKDQKLDIALLKIQESNGSTPTGLKPVTFGNSDKVRVAEPVFAVGNPFGLSHTVTTGIISAKSRTIGLGPLDNFLQTDASINPGNSGGPLFNWKAEVIGMNTSIYSKTGQSAGLGFAIPIDAAKAVLGDLKTHGRVPRPWLGILAQQVTPAMKLYYQLKSDSGVLVVNLVERAPSQKAGLKLGDIITEIEGSKVSENSEVERELYKKKPGNSVKVKVWRGNKQLEIPVRLDELPPIDDLPQGII